MSDKEYKNPNLESLLSAVEMSYRKHVLDDPEIGWEELVDRLLDAICNTVGSETYCLWIRQWETGERSLVKFLAKRKATSTEKENCQ